MPRRNHNAGRSSFVKELPLERRQRILRENPEVDPSALGLMAEPKKEAKAARKRSRHGNRITVSGITFDSQTEADCFEFLKGRYVTVFCHRRVQLCEDTPDFEGSNMEPDFIGVIEVRPDGTFLAECLDAKAEWKTPGGGRKPHMERDWTVRRKWLWDKFRIGVRIVTKGVIDRVRAGSDFPWRSQK